MAWAALDSPDLLAYTLTILTPGKLMPRKKTEPYSEELPCPVCGALFLRWYGVRGRPREYCGRSDDACKKLASLLGTTEQILDRVLRAGICPLKHKRIRSALWAMGNMSARGLPECPPDEEEDTGQGALF